MEHELEIKLSAQMNDVIKTLDNLTNKLKDGATTSDKYQKGIDTIVDELKKLNKGLENADSTTKFISKLKQLMGAVDKLNDVDVTNFRTNITNLFNTLQDVVANTVFVDNGFYKIATSLNRVVNGAMKINELDISLFREQFKELNTTILEMTKENENFANYDNSGYDKLVSSLTKVVNSAYKLNGVDLSAFRQQLIGVNETTYNVMKQFENIESNDVSKIIGRIANSVNRLNKIDLRKTYGTFQSLIRIIDPFLEKINASATALYTFNEVAKSLQSSATSVRVINNEFTKYDKTVKSATNSTGLFSVSMNRLYRIFRSVFSLFMSGQQKIIDYTESLNLFNVVMGNTDEQMSELGQKALYFQNTMAEAFGANTQTQLDYQAQYQAIAESMGIQEKYAYIISENLTKLSYDLSSLYNKTQDEVAKALQSGLVGQTRPVRTYGMDITQNSLTPVLESLGITDRTISDLTQAEKEILRYIAIIRQSSIAHGDLANTIESPSNQLKILKNQLVECQRWFSALFINTFAKALPYINGVVMAVKELMRALATLFGIEITDYNSGIATYSDSYADALDDVTDSADSASKAVKELTLQTLGFDQINNINENKSSGSSGSSGGSGGVGGIDERLLDAMEGYDNAMESVRMKASDIRDKIMDWLGFTKLIDPLTKEVSWKLREGLTNLKLIAGVIGTILGYKLITYMGKIITTGTKLSKMLGLNGIALGMKNLVEYTKKYTSLANGSLIKGIAGGTQAFVLQLSAITKVAGGLSLLATSLVFAHDSGKGLADSTKNLSGNLLELALSTSGAVAGGTLLGATFGPLGMTIGAVAGGVLALTTALSGYVAKRNEELAMAKLFDGEGVRIEALVSQYENLFNSSITWNDELTTLKNKYEETRLALTTAQEDLDIFRDKLLLQNEAISEVQLTELANKYDTLKQATVEATEANIAYASKLIESYQNTSKSSAEETAKQIADIKALMLANQDYQLEYINRMKEIEIQYYTGTIGASEYQQKVHELDLEFGKTRDITVDTQKVIDNFNETVKNIDYKDTETLKDNVKELHDNYKKTLDVLDEEKTNIDNYWSGMIDEQQKIVDNYDSQILKGKTLTEEEQKRYDIAKNSVTEYSNNLKTETEAINTKIEEVQSSYKGFISGIYADLVSSGASTTKEFKSTIKTIEGDLSSLKNVDMSGFGKNLFEGMISDILLNEPKNLSTLSGKFKEYGINAGDSFNNAVLDSLSDIQKRKALTDEAIKTGGFSVSGYRQGIEKESSSSAGMGKIGEKSIKETQDELQIKSPSKKYMEIGKYVILGFIEGINQSKSELMTKIDNLLKEMQNKFKSVTFSFNISTAVEGSFNSILNKLETFANKFRTGVNRVLSNMTSTMNSVFVGGDNRLYYNSMPYISVPKFANGGFPEDGLFYANHNELVGQFANGKTAVANNGQIIEGIKQGVYEAMKNASKNGINQSNIKVYASKDVIVETAINGINDITKQTGESPIEMW